MLAGSIASAQPYIYNNSTVDTGFFLNPGDFSMVADELILDGPGVGGALSIALSGTGVSGNEAISLTIFALDGAPDVYGSGYQGPGSVLWTGGGALNWGAGDHYSEWFTFDLGNLALPEQIAIAYTLSGVEANEVVGPHLYNDDGGLTNPPFSYNDYWRYDSNLGGWGLAVLGGGPDVPADFGITIAVPEASTVWSLGGIAALIGVTLYRRFRAS